VPAAPPRSPTLVILQENRPPQRRAVQGEATVGRDPSCQIALDDGYLSREHCAVTVHDGQVVARDLGSYNGTYVNGQRIEAETKVLPGDVLKVGRTRIFVDYGAGEQSESIQILAPALEPKSGVKPVARAKAPALEPRYQEIADSLPPPPPPPAPTPAPSGPQTGTSTQRQARQIRADDKTPVPPPGVEESAVARSSSRGRGAPLPRERGDAGMRAIAQIARVLTNASDGHEFVDFALSRILQVIPAERGIIMLLDPARRSLFAECVKSAVPDVDDDRARRQGISHTIARKVIRERVSVLVDDAVLDQRFKQASSVQELQVRSILCVPLWLGERVSGLIYLDHVLHAYAFTEADRDLLVAAANLVALGLERMRLG